MATSNNDYQMDIHTSHDHDNDNESHAAVSIIFRILLLESSRVYQYRSVNQSDVGEQRS